MSRLTTTESRHADAVRRDIDSRAAREFRAGHLADARDRAFLLRDIDARIQDLQAMRHEVHAGLGLVDNALDTGRLSTTLLHAVLATLRTWSVQS